jgi:hypothetical protein
MDYCTIGLSKRIEYFKFFIKYKEGCHSCSVFPKGNTEGSELEILEN